MILILQISNDFFLHIDYCLFTWFETVVLLTLRGWIIFQRFEGQMSLHSQLGSLVS